MHIPFLKSDVDAMSYILFKFIDLAKINKSVKNEWIQEFFDENLSNYFATCSLPSIL